MRYEIVGDPYPVVVCHCDKGEVMKNESGSMAWMDPWFDMQTKGGGIGRMFGRAFTGEAMFQNFFTAQEAGKIAFASSMPGTIIPLHIDDQHEFIVQKHSFLASEFNVDFNVHINEKIGVGIFAGKGFLMQRLFGNGIAFVAVDGSLVEYELGSGEQIVVDTGHVMGFSASVQMNIRRIRGAKNIVFGGEGLFNTTLTGPGTVWLQTMPLSGMAEALLPYIPTAS